ncbi:MAG: transposase [Chloroflexota bacterium]|nr:transposase [Chloroflexota bacterium]
MEDQVTVEFDPNKHHRRSIRLKGYDYSQSGAYSFTICANDRECLFGKIIDGEMRLNPFSEIAQACWDVPPLHYPHIELTAFLIMPNHVHGVIVIRRGEAFANQHRNTRESGSANASPLHPPHGTQPDSLGAIIQNFKSVSTRKINQSNQTPGNKVWQRNYYEHIIRDEKALHNIRRYIIENPLRWAEDEENPINIRTGERTCR